MVTGFGIIFESAFRCSEHIRTITCEAFTNLGFVKHNTQDFSNTTSIILLYNSLVRYELEFAYAI